MLWGFLFYDDYSNIAFPLAGKHAFSLFVGFLQFLDLLDFLLP